jgi:hypothetical protein
MTKLEADAETYIVYPLFALGAAISLGIISGDILPVIDLSNTLATIGGIEWTGARVLSLVALGAVMFNRDSSFDFAGWGTVELWVLYATLGLIIAPPFFPALQETLVGGVAAFVSFTVQSIGFVLITYIN